MRCRTKLKILLLQIRENEEIIAEEQFSFARFAGIDQNQFKILNVFQNPNFGTEVLKGVDALFVGGASEASVSEPEKYPFVDSIKELLNHCVNINLPVFASCFGFQAAVLAFGGIITKDTNDFEMGTYPIQLTTEALKDPIYKNTPSGFQAVSVHQEKATELPANCELHGFTLACCHSFKVKDKPFWAFQFHPELDRECLTVRLKAYQDQYTNGDDHFNQVIASLQDVDHANNLVRNFVDYLITT